MRSRRPSTISSSAVAPSATCWPQARTRLRRLTPAAAVAARDGGAVVVVLCQEGYTSSLAAAASQDLGVGRATDVRAAGRPGADLLARAPAPLR